MAVELLRREGYACEEAHDAHEAAHMLTAREYDLLVSDLEMPGNENLRLLRKVPQIAAGLPIILMTAYPTVESAIQSIQLPVRAYMVKPFDSAHFLSEARRAVSQYQAYRAIRANHQRVDEWNRALARIEATVKDSRPGDRPPWEGLLDLTLRNITHSLADLRLFTEIVARQQGSDANETLAESIRPVEMAQALRETIAVLEKTRTAFKSKDLGALRKKLQTLVPEAPAGKSPPGT